MCYFHCLNFDNNSCLEVTYWSQYIAHSIVCIVDEQHKVQKESSRHCDETSEKGK